MAPTPPMSRLPTARTAPVAVAPTRAIGDNAPLKRGAEIYPVPDQCAGAGLRRAVAAAASPSPAACAVPPGSTSSAEGDEADAAAASFRRARRQPVSRSKASCARRPRAAFRSPCRCGNGFGAGGLCDPLFADGVDGLRRHAHRPALRPDHARPDPARRAASPRDLPVSRPTARSATSRRWAGAAASRRRAAVLRHAPRSRSSCRSSPGTSSTASTGICPTTRPGASRSTPIPQLTRDRRLARPWPADPAAARLRARSVPAATTARRRSARSSRWPAGSASR